MLHFVNSGYEGIARPHGLEARFRLHGLREKANVFKGDTFDVHVGNDLYRIEWPSPKTVIDDVMPHLEEKQTPDERFVQSTLAE
ncbi:MAG: hypothetical protein ABR507_03330 [Actinomycetota bacterium]|nr:hypothetical protein [Actinomycetota bacterium]